MPKKEEFMSHYWVEERHEFIKNLEEEEQEELLDSLSDSDIDRNVNVRKFQEDYIADYLSDLFCISETSFWKHIKIMFRGQGVLWSDNMEYVTFIMNEEIDNELLWLILESYLKEGTWDAQEHGDAHANMRFVAFEKLNSQFKI